MARTRGHGNPNWTRDETILALELFLTCSQTVPPPTDSRIQELSTLLRSLPLHDPSVRQPSFRNPDGVGFKLQNLRQLATGLGLEHVSTIDKQVWADLGTRREEVQEIAVLIRANANHPGLLGVCSEGDDDQVFFEGRIATALHKTKERDRRLRKRLLSARRRSGALTCDLCGTASRVLDPSFEDATFEAHHLAGVQQEVRLSDLALLCATCHRLIHRAISLERRWLGLAAARQVLGLVGTAGSLSPEPLAPPTRGREITQLSSL